MAIQQFCFECVSFGNCPGMRAGRPRDDDDLCGEFKSTYEDLYEKEMRYREAVASLETLKKES